MTGPTLPADPGVINQLLNEVRVVPGVMTPDIPYDRKCGAGHGCDFGDRAPTFETREEILQRDMSNVILDSHGRVISGTEIDPYSNALLSSPQQVQIDHIVPLQMAWDMGAEHWTQQQREAFANDHDELWAVSGTQNQAKSWMGPGEWLPPNTAEDQDYVERYLKIDVKYGLPITTADRDAIRAVIGELPMTSPTPPPLHILKGYGSHLSTLQQSANTHNQVADTWDDVFSSQQQRVTGQQWFGAGPDSVDASVTRDSSIVGQQSDQLRQAATVTEQALPDLRSSYEAIINKVEQIQSDKFDVTDDYGVRDTLQTTNVETMLEREAQAQIHAAQLAALVGKWWQSELATHAKLTALSNVHEFSFAPPPLWHVEHYDDPNHGHYNPDYPTPATPYEKAHHGSNFNDGIILDTTDVTSSGPEFIVEGPPVQGDWPNPNVTSDTGPNAGIFPVTGGFAIDTPITDQTGGQVVSPFYQNMSDAYLPPHHHHNLIRR